MTRLPFPFLSDLAFLELFFGGGGFVGGLVGGLVGELVGETGALVGGRGPLIWKFAAIPLSECERRWQ